MKLKALFKNGALLILIFLQGHDDRFTVYIHASREQPVHVSRYFAGRDIHSEKVSFPIQISFIYNGRYYFHLLSILG